MFDAQEQNGVGQVLLDSIGYAYCLISSNQAVQYWSVGMETLSGVSAQQALGRVVFELWPALRGTLLQEAIETALGGYTSSVICGLVAPQGRRVEVEARAEPWPNGILLLLRDLHHPIEIERMQRRVDERLRAILNSDPDPVLLLSSDLAVLDANTAAAALFETSRLAMLDRPVGEIWPVLGASLFLSAPRWVDKGQGAPVFRLCRKDGRYVDVAAVVTPLRNGDGPAFVLRLKDQTILRLIETECWQMKERFRALVQAAEDLIFVLDSYQRFVFVNQRGLARFSLTPDQVTGKTVSEVFGAEIGSLFTSYFQKMLATGESVEFETAMDLAGGTTWNHTVLAPVLDGEGVVLGATGISRDLTETIRLHQQAVEAERLLTAQQLAGAVSHEFAQPLQALQLIAEGDLRACNPVLAERLMGVIERIGYLVTRLKRLSRVETRAYGGQSIIDLERSAGVPAARRVLIVDDEKSIRDLLSDVVRHFGIETDAVENGAQALDVLQRTAYGLVICDMSMPVMDGLTFYAQARQTHPRLPFLFMTGYAINDEDHQAIAQSLGYLQKPFGVESVRQALAKVFGDL